MYELELSMGMILRDNTVNLSNLVDMVAKSIEIHQSLGLKPKFGDPALNLQINVGQGVSSKTNETETERVKRLQAIKAELDAVPPEQREWKRRQILARYFPGLVNEEYLGRGSAASESPCVN